MKLLAWHNNPDLKAEVLERMIAHRAEDSIIQGFYQEADPGIASGFRGCAIGCTLPLLSDDPSIEISRGWHSQVETLYGIPISVGYLIDQIFEDLLVTECADFAVASIKAIPVGADLSLVDSRFTLDILSDPAYGVLRLTEPGTRERQVIETVVGLYQRRLAGDEPQQAEWLSTRSAADKTPANDRADHALVCAANAAAIDISATAAASAWAVAVDAQSGVDSWWDWMVDRFLHHLATAPIPTQPTHKINTGD